MEQISKSTKEILAEQWVKQPHYDENGHKGSFIAGYDSRDGEIKKLRSALIAMTNLAEHGVEKAASNSRPEERAGHEDGLRSLIEDCKEVLSKYKNT